MQEQKQGSRDKQQPIPGVEDEQKTRRTNCGKNVTTEQDTEAENQTEKLNESWNVTVVCEKLLSGLQTHEEQSSYVWRQLRRFDLQAKKEWLMSPSLTAGNPP